MSDRRQLPRRKNYGSGVFRRRIALQRTAEGAAAELEDDFHHFGVSVRIDGRRVAAVSAAAARYPWTTCPAAGAALAELVGSDLSPSFAEIATRSDPALQCTHQFDLACLAIAGAALGIAARTFDATIPELRERRTRATLASDGRERLAWEIEGMTIAGPAPFRGLALGRGFVEWVEAELCGEEALEAHLLRRATFIAFGRQYDFDAMPDPSAFAAATGSRCHSFRSGVIEGARRIVGSARDFDTRPEDLLAAPEVLDAG